MLAQAKQWAAQGRRVVACRLLEGERPDWRIREEGGVTHVHAGGARDRFLKEWRDAVDVLYVGEASDTLVRLADRETHVVAAAGDVPRRYGTRPVKAPVVRRAAVIGGGLAGALVSHYLQRLGVSVDLYDAAPTPGAGASALYAGLFHPHWQASDNPLFRLTRAGFDEMLALKERFAERFACDGVIDAAPDDTTWQAWRQAASQGRPFAMSPAYAQLLTAKEGSARCGLSLKRGAWWYPKAGTVCVSGLVRDLIEDSRARVFANTRVRLQRAGEVWRVIGPAAAADYEAVVVAAGPISASLAGLPDALMRLDVLYGRISLPIDRGFEGLKCAVTGSGYLVRRDGFLGLGATYEPKGPNMTAEAAHAHNAALFRKIATLPPDYLPAGFYEGARAVSGDRLPIAGPGLSAEAYAGLSFRGAPEIDKLPVAPGLWFCTGFGSRGISWGAWAARLTASQVAGEPLLAPASLVRAVSPLRFAERAFRATRGAVLF